VKHHNPIVLFSRLMVIGVKNHFKFKQYFGLYPGRWKNTVLLHKPLTGGRSMKYFNRFYRLHFDTPLVHFSKPCFPFLTLLHFFTRYVPPVEQELLTLPEHLSSPPVLVGFALLDL